MAGLYDACLKPAVSAVYVVSQDYCVPSLSSRLDLEQKQQCSSCSGGVDIFVFPVDDNVQHIITQDRLPRKKSHNVHW